MKTDQEKFKRVFVIIRLLTSQSKGISISEISKAINKSERTIYRYFRLFRELGFILETIETTDETLYRLKKNEANVSEIFDYLPELHYPGKKPIPKLNLKKFKDPVWIYKGRGKNEYIVYDSLIALTEQHEVENVNNLYMKLRKSYQVISPNYRIIRAPFFKRIKKRQ